MCHRTPVGADAAPLACTACVLWMAIRQVNDDKSSRQLFAALGTSREMHLQVDNICTRTDAKARAAQSIAHSTAQHATAQTNSPHLQQVGWHGPQELRFRRWWRWVAWHMLPQVTQHNLTPGPLAGRHAGLQLSLVGQDAQPTTTAAHKCKQQGTLALARHQTGHPPHHGCSMTTMQHSNMG